MKQRIIELINKEEVDVSLFFKFYLENGGENIGIDMFEQLLRMYCRGKSVEQLYRNMCIKNGVNLLRDVDGNLIMAC